MKLRLHYFEIIRLILIIKQMEETFKLKITVKGYFFRYVKMANIGDLAVYNSLFAVKIYRQF